MGIMDLTNRRFGRLVALKLAGKGKQGYNWLYQCDCGNQIIVPETYLRYSKRKKCNQCPNFEDYTGRVFGRYTVLHVANHRSSGGGVLWTCKCACGTIKEVQESHLRSKSSVSCGCYAKAQSAQRFKKSRHPKVLASRSAKNTHRDGVHLTSLYKSRRNRTGVLGVGYSEPKQMYLAYLCFHGEVVLQKYCKTFKEAAQLRKSAEQRYFPQMLLDKIKQNQA